MKGIEQAVKEITIGRRKYEHLKSLKNITDEEQRLIELYEEKRKPTAHNQKFMDEYNRKVFNPVPEDELKINAKKLVNTFLFNYKKFNDRDFILNEETKVNLYTIAYYFAKDERFLNSPNLIENLKFGNDNKTSKPSLNKGLLIIGNFGNGKSSMLKTFCKTLQNARGYNFNFIAANDLVRDYNCLNSPEARKAYWQRIEKKRLLIDDAKTEEEASNYGKMNIVKHIIETRADHKKTTHMICNFKKGFPNDIENAILEIGEKYGSRAFDRIFGNYNIIHFKGKSFRN